MAANDNRRFLSEKCLLEFQRDVFAQIGAALNAIAAASSAAKQVAKAEELAEDIAEVLEYGGIETAASGADTAQPGMPETIIDGPLFRVGEDGISLAHFLELLFRVGIVRIAVRMVLQRKLPVRAFEFDFRARAGYAQHLVVVTFCVRSQIRPFTSPRPVLSLRDLICQSSLPALRCGLSDATTRPAASAAL